VGGTPNTIADFGREKGEELSRSRIARFFPFYYEFFQWNSIWVCARFCNGFQGTRRPVKIKQHAGR
jgi:hypothetical protein